MMRSFLTVAVACFVSGLTGCTSQLAGGGTETTNGILGTVAVEHGSAACGGSIIAAVFSVTYRPDSCIGFAETAFVNTSGSFRFDSLADGRYNLFVWDTARGLGTFRPDLPADTTLGTIELAATGAVVAVTPISAADEIRLEMMIPGTPFYAPYTPGKPAVLINVPRGDYLLDWRDPSHPADNGPDYAEKKISIGYSSNQDTVQVLIP